MADIQATVDSPYKHSQRALELEAMNDFRHAEAEYKAAIKAADKLPLQVYRDDYTSRRAHHTVVQHASGQDFGQESLVDSIDDLERSYQELLALPFLTRMQLCGFYARHDAIPEAKEACEDALRVGLDEVSTPNRQLNGMLKRAKHLYENLSTIIGPSDPSTLFEANFDKLDKNRDGFVDQEELKRAQLDLSLDADVQQMIRFLLYHYFDVEKASNDELGMEISGITKRDVRKFQKQSQSDWKRMSNKKK